MKRLQKSVKKFVVAFGLFICGISSVSAATFPFLTDIDIGKVVRKLFGIKRFASVEFSAKQAFENLNIAMALLQFFLILATLILLGFIVIGLWQRKKQRVKKALHALLHRLSCEVVLLDYKTKNQNGELEIKFSKDETISHINRLLNKRYKISRMQDHHRNIIEKSLLAIAKNLLSIEHQQVLIEQIKHLV